MDELKVYVLKATSKVIYEEAKKVVYILNRKDADPIEANEEENSLDMKENLGQNVG